MLGRRGRICFQTLVLQSRFRRCASTQKRKGVALMQNVPTHSTIESRLKSFKGGGAGIGDACVKGIKYVSGGNHRVFSISPNR